MTVEKRIRFEAMFVVAKDQVDKARILVHQFWVTLQCVLETTPRAYVKPSVRLPFFPSPQRKIARPAAPRVARRPDHFVLLLDAYDLRRPVDPRATVLPRHA
jgi:hypothetical protein